MSEDRAVRTALLEYQTHLLDGLNPTLLTPFADLYTAYTVSALTSLHKGVRRDGLALLTLLLKTCPAAIAQRCSVLLPNYANLMASDPASKAQALRWSAAQSLLALLHATTAALPQQQHSDSSVLSSQTHNINDVPWISGSTQNSAFLTWQFTTASASATSLDAMHPSAAALIQALPVLLDRLYDMWVEACGSSTTTAAKSTAAAAVFPANTDQLQLVLDILLSLATHPSLQGMQSILPVTNNAVFLRHCSFAVHKPVRTDLVRLLQSMPFLTHLSKFTIVE